MADTNATLADSYVYREREYTTTDVWGNEHSGSIWSFDQQGYGQALKSIDDSKTAKIKSIESERAQSASVGIKKRAIERQRDIDQGRSV